MLGCFLAKILWFCPWRGPEGCEASWYLREQYNSSSCLEKVCNIQKLAFLQPLKTLTSVTASYEWRITERNGSAMGRWKASSRGEKKKKGPKPQSPSPKYLVLVFNNSLSYYDAKAHRIMVFSNIMMDVSQPCRKPFVLLLCADPASDLGFAPQRTTEDKSPSSTSVSTRAFSKEMLRKFYKHISTYNSLTEVGGYFRQRCSQAACTQPSRSENPSAAKQTA